MPSIEMDVRKIPDIIEAQLTLNYTRLAELIAVIVDQGNSNNADIDILKCKLEELSRENKELKATVRQFQEERTSGTAELFSNVELLKKDTRQLKIDLGQAAKTGEDALGHITAVREEFSGKIAEVQKTVNNVQVTLSSRIDALTEELHTTQAFVDLWASSPATCDELTQARGPNATAAHIEKQTEYLHSLPAFQKLYDDIDVMKRVLQQHAEDSAAMRVVTDERRESLRSLTGGAANARNSGEAFTNALESIHVRLGALEEQLHEQENRIPRSDANIAASRKSSAGVPSQGERAFESRLTALEQAVNGSLQRLESRRISTPVAATRRATVTNGQQGKVAADAVENIIPRPHVEALRQRLSVMDAVSRKNSVTVLDENNGLRLRVAQLEEGTAMLEDTKVGRDEFANFQANIEMMMMSGKERLNETVPQRPLSANGGLNPQPPVLASKKDFGARFSASAGVVADQPQAMNRPSSASRPFSANMYGTRPLFVRSSSTNLRDSSGIFTPASVSPREEQ